MCDRALDSCKDNLCEGDAGGRPKTTRIRGAVNRYHTNVAGKLIQLFVLFVILQGWVKYGATIRHEGIHLGRLRGLILRREWHILAWLDVITYRKVTRWWRAWDVVRS